MIQSLRLLATKLHEIVGEPSVLKLRKHPPSLLVHLIRVEVHELHCLLKLLRLHWKEIVDLCLIQLQSVLYADFLDDLLLLLQERLLRLQEALLSILGFDLKLFEGRGELDVVLKVLGCLLEGFALALDDEGIYSKHLAKVREDLQLECVAVLRVKLALSHK